MRQPLEFLLFVTDLRLSLNLNLSYVSSHLLSNLSLGFPSFQIKDQSLMLNQIPNSTQPPKSGGTNDYHSNVLHITDIP